MAHEDVDWLTLAALPDAAAAGVPTGVDIAADDLDFIPRRERWASGVIVALRTELRPAAAAGVETDAVAEPEALPLVEP